MVQQEAASSTSDVLIGRSSQVLLLQQLMVNSDTHIVRTGLK